MTALTRRDMLRAGFTTAVVVGTSAAVAPIVLAEPAGASAEPQAPAVPAAPAAPGSFDEVYRGRRIQGGPSQAVGYAAARSAAAPAAGPGVEITVDGRPLHVMRRADGTYLSLVNHYESFRTPLEVARAAVDQIGTAQLAPASFHHH
ncbi:tyrosinase family oxidase copper chaperone [Streptomyces sp. WAC06614]|uniref:tyrosinase family oxidase copper chaperone n=1 Tax=Streptomyces sp. WAC06614 TaxID=2487416 RepID=UPI000F785D3E|nr:tyrosinase family oxidase copper chaperone [Streptomyces sp. WAC06614]RSS80369.1 tyrosinase [Streptomyces sp. WAC06614]